VDRESSRVAAVENEVFDLFALLGASDAQLDFPTLYASAREGWAVRRLQGEPRTSMRPLLDAIVAHVPPPTLSADAARGETPFGMVVTMIQRDAWLGRLVTGRIAAGTVRVGDAVQALTLAGTNLETGRVTKIVKRRGVTRVDLADAVAGDIVTLAGLSRVSVTDTVGALTLAGPLPAVPVDPPTVSMTFSVNDAPLAGRAGTKLTSQQIGERLRQEVETNVSLRVLVRFFLCAYHT
jgi:GTP-binding protein